ncbi:MAG: malto-oligosyltrehalose synthase, partial [Methylibium sp.]|nr:malto-oligosyltrehalose synthase [Methylibium sp.]
DVVDPTRIDPEIGGRPALRRLMARLRERGMGLVADIVPNHMGVAGRENAWWQDVLEWGPSSPYAQWFDIDWEPDDLALHGKLLAPYLGEPYGETLTQDDLQLRFDEEDGRFWCAYHDHRFPIAPTSHVDVLRALPPHPTSPQRGEEPTLQSLAERFEGVLPEPDADNVARWQAACAALAAVAATDAGRAHIDALLARHSTQTEEGRRRLHALLERQHYRLAWWRCAADQINWRRFFEVSDLAGLAVEREDVFEASHSLVFDLYAEGLIDGVRIDHIDGLADPEGYCLALRRRLTALHPGRPEALREGRPYIVVEKILAVGEALPKAWQTDGTSGYDFMDQVGALLHEPAGAEPLAALWREFSGRPFDFPEEALQARRQILAENLAAEREACARAFHRVARASLATRDWALTSIRRVLTELLVHFPVYRSYPGPDGRSTADRKYLAHAAAGARAGLRSADHALLEQLKRWLNGTPSSELHRKALTRFEQLSAPLTAKSVEDTAFYRYGRLLSRNEVGSDPAYFALGADAFHRLGRERAEHWPAAMLATATHDHKRGEDLRARLAVLSEMPAEWAVIARHWRELNVPARRTRAGGAEVPSGGQELMLYQMLVGAWPLALDAGDREGLTALAERIAAWQTKALREAKQLTGWTAPDEEFEAACRSFLFAILGLEEAAPA